MEMERLKTMEMNINIYLKKRKTPQMTIIY